MLQVAQEVGKVDVGFQTVCDDAPAPFLGQVGVTKSEPSDDTHIKNSDGPSNGSSDEVGPQGRRGG